MKHIKKSLLLLAFLLNTGCDRDSSSGDLNSGDLNSGNLNSGNGQVAIIDLDAVAQKLGRDKQILQMIEERQVSLNQQVLAAQNSLIEQLNQKKTELGELSDDEAKQLSQLQGQANSILATTKNQAQANLTSYQQEVVSQFREEAKPIALELATKKGCRVVLSKNDTVVFAFDKTVDLTDEVVAYMQSKGSPPASAQSQAKRPVSPGAPTKQASADVGTKTMK